MAGNRKVPAYPRPDQQEAIMIAVIRNLLTGLLFVVTMAAVCWALYLVTP